MSLTKRMGRKVAQLTEAGIREVRLTDGRKRFEARTYDDFEHAMKALMKQAQVCSQCGWPDEWVKPLESAAVLLAETAAYKSGY